MIKFIKLLMLSIKKLKMQSTLNAKKSTIKIDGHTNVEYP